MTKPKKGYTKERAKLWMVCTKCGEEQNRWRATKCIVLGCDGLLKRIDKPGFLR
jgi:hypothetical protein